MGFHRDTMILTNTGAKKASDVQVGDLLNCSGNIAAFLGQVSQINISRSTLRGLRFSCRNPNTLQTYTFDVTEDHFCLPLGERRFDIFKRAIAIVNQDFFTDGAAFCRITNIQPIELRGSYYFMVSTALGVPPPPICFGNGIKIGTV